MKRNGATAQRRKAFVVLCAVASLRPSALLPQDPVALIRRASSVYRGLASLQAEFVQVIEDGSLGDTLTTTGRLYQSGQNAFAMRFSDPPEEAIVIDGRHTWIYTPSTSPGQVIRMSVESDPVYGVNLLARLLDRPADRYATTWLRTDQVNGRKVEVVAIVPRSANANFSRAVLWLDAEDALPRRIELDEAPRVRRILTLSRLRPNATIPRELFEFKVPRGVRVVDQ